LPEGEVKPTAKRVGHPRASGVFNLKEKGNRMKALYLFLAIVIGLSFAEPVLAFPDDYDQLYLLLSWSKDARSMALGDGIVVVPDGYHNDALLNPSFAALTNGWYFSANTHLTLVDDRYGPFFTSSHRGSGYQTNLPLDAAQLQKVEVGASLPHHIGVEFSLLRNYVRETMPLLGAPPSNPTVIQRVNSELYGLTISFRPLRCFAIGVSGKYFESRLSYDDKVYHYKWSHNGTSYDVGASLINLFPRLSFQPQLGIERHFYSRFRDTVHAGINAAVSIRDFGPRSTYPVPLGPYHDLPTTFKASISYLPIKSNVITIELFGGFAQNYKGTYQEDFWDFAVADLSYAVELTALNLVRFRLSTFQSDLNNCNGWGVSVGPNWCQVEYAQIKDLGILTDNFATGVDGREVLSLTLNYSFH
jgi:hypothetical protein